jgi:hypothetical protein
MSNEILDMERVERESVVEASESQQEGDARGDCDICGAWCGSLVRGVCRHCQKRYGLE